MVAFDTALDDTASGRVSNSASAFSQQSGALSSSQQTVTEAGSNLVFINSYGSEILNSSFASAFESDVTVAEHYLQSHFTAPTTVTVDVTFDWSSLNGGSASNNFYVDYVSYSQLVQALARNATTPAAQAAVAALEQMADPSNGANYSVPIGEAIALGLNGGTASDTVTFATQYWTAANFQSDPGDVEATILHELSEGVMGRVGSLGIADSHWAPLDLFRFTASGQRDYTGGSDGYATYFSTNGQFVYTGLQYHNSNATGTFDGEDLGDWDQVGADAYATDPFGPGGANTGASGILSPTDLEILNVLGWQPRSSNPNPNPFTAIDGHDDFEGDGTSDVLFSDGNGDLGEFVMNNGTPTWRAVGSVSSNWQVVGTGDFFGNGTSDILFRNPTTGALGMFEMNNSTLTDAPLTWQGVGSTSTNWHVAGTGDFDGDGTTDILFSDGNGDFGMFDMNNGTPTWQSIGSVGSQWQLVGIGDFSGNGTDDLLFRDSSGDLGEFVMNNGTPTWESVGSTSSNWQVAGTGDFFGNGTSDILFSDGNGDYGMFAMNNGTPTWESVGSVGSNWHLAGIGDYYGNGTSDLLFHNPTTGGLGMFAMNNGTPTWEGVGATSTNWNIVGASNTVSA